MTDLEPILKHMAQRFESSDPFVMAQITKLEADNAYLRHRIMVLETEIYARNAANVELNRQLLELLRERSEGTGTNPECSAK